MNVTSTNNVTKTMSGDFAYNPDSQLTGDDFMKLFLTELQYQDPTAPMETQDMLNQTGQLTQLQTNQDLKDALNNLTTSMGASAQFTAVSMIGKMADTGANGFAVTDSANLTQDIPFDLYFGDDFLDATVKIKDSNGDVVKSFSLDSDEKGLKNFTWDATDDNGNPVSDGEYFITADYTTKDKDTKISTLGVYPVDAVKFNDGKALLKLANNYIPLDSIKEVY